MLMLAPVCTSHVLAHIWVTEVSLEANELGKV